MTDTSAPGGGAATHVVLLGMMGAGKTTTALALGRELGWPVRDNDQDLEAATGRTGADIAASEGVQALHDLEARHLLDALAAPPPTVIAAAASVADATGCRRALSERATTVWLDAPAESLAGRRASGRHRRPVEPRTARALDEQRRTRLEAIADLRLDARRSRGQLVADIIAHLERRCPPTGEHE